MNSVLAQEFDEWEHIIVDDGSDDGSAEEVARRSTDDPRIRFLHREGASGGANICRNQGLRAARANLVVFLDSDDVLEPDCLKTRVRFMNRNCDIDFLVSRTGVFISTPGDLGRELDPEMIGDDLLRFLYFETPWQTTAVTWRRTTLDRLGGWDDSLLSWQDVDLHIRAIANGMRYLRVPFIDHHMRWQEHPEKISTKQRRSPEHLDAADSLLEKFEMTVRDGPGMNWVRQRAICSLYFLVAELWAEIGEPMKAVYFWRNIRRRKLGSIWLYVAGYLLLWLKASNSPLRVPAKRLCHKWKGWSRLRMDPELIAP